MFVRLTRANRLRAGWLLAVVYLLCVLAPTISFALPGEARAALCLTDEDHNLGIMHVHEASRLVVVQHGGGQAHEHSDASAQSGHVSGHDHLKSSAAGEPSSPAGGGHKAPAGQCCGMVCVSALPATIIEIVKPSEPATLYVSETYQNVADKSPPRLYRPPIS